MQQSTTLLRHPVTDVVITTGEYKGAIQVLGLEVGIRARQKIARLASSGYEHSTELNETIRLLTDYLNGRRVDLLDIPVEFGTRTAFQREVLLAARRIPYGHTWSYGELARQAGYPKAVRAVASVMRRNTLPLLIPCHRVIRSDGTIGGYCGSLGGEDSLLKQRLLALEARCG